MQFIQNEPLLPIESPIEQSTTVFDRYPGWMFLSQLLLSLLLLVGGYLFIFFDPLNWVSPLYQEPLQYTVAGLMLLMAPIGVYLSARNFLMRPHFWRTHCPRCQCESLRREKRTRRDRIFGRMMRLPLFRYSCASCDWRGKRIEHGRL